MRSRWRSPYTLIHLHEWPPMISPKSMQKLLPHEAMDQFKDPNKRKLIKLSSVFFACSVGATFSIAFAQENRSMQRHYACLLFSPSSARFRVVCYLHNSTPFFVPASMSISTITLSISITAGSPANFLLIFFDMPGSSFTTRSASFSISLSDFES